MREPTTQTNQTMKSLEQLALDDPDVSLLARLYRDAIVALDDPVWATAASGLEKPRGDQAWPALNGMTLPFAVHATQRLMEGMIESSGLRTHWPEVVAFPKDVDMVRYISALAEWDVETIHEIADETAVDTAVILTLGTTVIIPQFNAFRDQLAVEPDSNTVTGRTCCPVCASWPVLAEQRGLEKQIWLRCARCFSAWRSNHQLCIYCGTIDYQKLGYMAGEGERESRRVATCTECRGHLKVLSTVAPLDPGELLRRDLESLELDVAATDADYTRPEQPGCPIDIEAQIADSPARSWFPWR